MLRDERRRPRLLLTELRVLMDVTAPGNQLVFDLRRALANLLLEIRHDRLSRRRERASYCSEYEGRCQSAARHAVLPGRNGLSASGKLGAVALPPQRREGPLEPRARSRDNNQSERDALQQFGIAVLWRRSAIADGAKHAAALALAEGLKLGIDDPEAAAPPDGARADSLADERECRGL
jgi:hypothetical protein